MEAKAKEERSAEAKTLEKCLIAQATTEEAKGQCLAPETNLIEAFLKLRESLAMVWEAELEQHAAARAEAHRLCQELSKAQRTAEELERRMEAMKQSHAKALLDKDDEFAREKRSLKEQHAADMQRLLEADHLGNSAEATKQDHCGKDQLRCLLEADHQGTSAEATNQDHAVDEMPSDSGLSPIEELRGPEDPESHTNLRIVESDTVLVHRWIKKCERSHDVRSREAAMAMKRFMKSRSTLRSDTRSRIVNTINQVHQLGNKSEKDAWIGIATPTVLYVHRIFLVNSHYGDWLTERRCMGVIITLLLLILALVVVISEVVSESKSMYEGTDELKMNRRSSGWWALTLIISSVALFHISHRINREVLFMAFCYFEFNMIIGSQVCARFLHMYNLYTTFHVVGLFDPAWQVWQILAFFFAELPMTVFAASIDSFYVRRKGAKSVIIAVIFSLHCSMYLNNRFFASCWSSKPVKLFGISLTTARNVYCQMESVICIFLGRVLIAQFMGKPWTLLRPDYLPPNHGEALNPSAAVLAAQDSDSEHSGSQMVSVKSKKPWLSQKVSATLKKAWHSEINQPFQEDEQHQHLQQQSHLGSGQTQHHNNLRRIASESSERGVSLDNASP